MATSWQLDHGVLFSISLLLNIVQLLPRSLAVGGEEIIAGNPDKGSLTLLRESKELPPLP